MFKFNTMGMSKLHTEHLINITITSGIELKIPETGNPIKKEVTLKQ